MSKYVISLCASLYLVLIIFGAPSGEPEIEGETIAEVDTAPPAQAQTAILPVETATRDLDPVALPPVARAADVPVASLVEVAATPVTVRSLDTTPTDRTSTSIATAPAVSTLQTAAAQVPEIDGISSPSRSSP